MRGIVYRHGRRRAASVVLALGVAAAFAGGASAVATAKPARSTAARANPARAARSHGKPPVAVAHATGHKIA
jgi:hypothetical protein